MIRAFTAALAALILGGTPGLAQSPFSPAIIIDDQAVTYYEIAQRELLLEAFRTPGDLAEQAREQLIEDRLKLARIASEGIRLTDEGLLGAMEDFAGRANLSLPEFLQVLAQAGVSEETFRDYVRVGVTWRDYIRSRYGDRVEVSEAEIDAALATLGAPASEVEVLLSEIIIPAPPPRAAAAQAEAERISRLTSFAGFEAAARQVSALPSRERGGRLDWLPISNYPAPLRPLILDLAPGEVTAPIQIPGAVALFQLRDIREARRPAEAPALIDYAVLTLPTLEDAGIAAGLIDTCDDLYGIARTIPPEQLLRQEVAPAAIPSDVAVALAALDHDEFTVLGADGAVRLVMLCSRTSEAGAGVDREAVEAQLRGQLLEGYAAALLADLRADAVIRLP